MIKQVLLDEFLYEVENTRKLLNAIPDAALSYKPSEHNWTTAQLASHIAEIYNWYEDTLNKDVFEIESYTYDIEDTSKVANIVAKFEENAIKAHQAFENFDESTIMNTWRMIAGGKDAIPPRPKIQVIRGFLYNHVYHHRGEMIIYLRSTGNKVPGLYGPTYEQSNF